MGHLEEAAGLGWVCMPECLWARNYWELPGASVGWCGLTWGCLVRPLTMPGRTHKKLEVRDSPGLEESTSYRPICFSLPSSCFKNQ